MKSYECLNPQCGHKWETDEEIVFECPKCHLGNFQEINNDESWFKKHIKVLLVSAIGIALFVILLIVLPESGTKVEVNKQSHSLSVTLKGDEVTNYSIRLYRKDRSYDKTVSNIDKKVFSNLYGGPYKLQIKYIGNKKNAPKLSKYTDTFKFHELQNTSIPEITNVISDPEKLTKSIKEYSITIITDTSIVPLKQTEFSMNGEDWQSESTFLNVLPGRYMFYTRNKKDKSAIAVTQEYEFLPYTPHVVTKEEVNTLMNKLYNGDLDAASKLKKLCGENTKVKGLETYDISNVSGLCTYIVAEQARLTCTITLNKENPEIVESINIQK